MHDELRKRQGEDAQTSLDAWGVKPEKGGHVDDEPFDSRVQGGSGRIKIQKTSQTRYPSVVSIMVAWNPVS